MGGVPQQQVVYQQQGQPPQQVIYQQPQQQPQQVVYQQQGVPQQQFQPQQQYQQQYQPQGVPQQQYQPPVQGAQGQPVVVVQGQTPIQQQPLYGVEVVDDPTCIYIFACFGFFFTLVGWIGMCVYGCGSNLPPQQAQAFRVLVICTILGLVINIIFLSMEA